MFDLPDPAFVGAAYLRVLGRAADPQGFVFHLRTLREDIVSRATVLARLQSSPEACEQRRSGLPMAQATAHRVLWPAVRRPSRRRLARNRRELCLLDGEVFVETAFAWHGLAQPDGDVLALWAPRCRELAGRKALLAELEARSGGWLQRLWRRTPGTPASPSPVPSSEAACAPARPESGPVRVSARDQSATLAIFTIASRRYRPFVETLMRSVRRHHPEAALFAVLADEPDAGDPPLEVATLVPARALGVPTFDDMSLRYDVLELSTALKPFAFRWLFGNTAARAVVYLDPDIRLYAPLAPVTDALERGATMLLTPHITAPLPGGRQPDDHTILASGAYNLGFAAIARSPETAAYVDWWAERLRTGSLVDFAANLFTDQRWCDLAPSFVPGFEVLRHPGCNVAYWNLAHRDVRETADRWEVNGTPLVFFHFSGLGTAAGSNISRHQDRFAPGEPASVQPLLQGYRAELAAAGWDRWHSVPWAWGCVGGAVLPESGRALYRHLFPHPVPSTREEAEVELMRHVAGPSGDGDTELPLLIRLVHGRDTQAVRCFDTETAEGRRALVEWFDASAVHACNLIGLRARARRLEGS